MFMRCLLLIMVLIRLVVVVALSSSIPGRRLKGPMIKVVLIAVFLCWWWLASRTILRCRVRT